MKLHPFTAVRDAAAYGVRIGSFGFFVGLMGSTTDVVPVPAGFGVAVAGFLAGAGYGVARYAVFEYELGEHTLEIRSGVLRRQEREIPLGRVQNVDVEQSFLGRLLGLAAVRFETAGGGETEGELRLVGIEEAESLQAELRRRKRRARSEEGGPLEEGALQETGAPPPEPERTLLFELSLAELLVLAGVSFRWGVAPLLAFAFPLFEDVLFGIVERLVRSLVRGGEPSLADPGILLVGLAGGLGYLLLTWVVSAAITVVQYYDFRLERIDDELVYERGLLQRYSGTIPLDKVQTLSVEENVLMRRFGYAALSVETAGYAPGSGGGSGRSPSAIPLADRETVLSLVESIEGVDDVDVDRPPRRARRRYAGRYALVVLAMAGAFAAVHLLLWPLGVLWALPVGAGLAVLPAAHLKWANLGHRTGEHHFLAREGFWRRSTRVVPYYRLQTVLTVRTVFQRRWSLASVVGDTASSSNLLSRDATAHDVDLGVARDLHDALHQRLQADLAGRRAGRGRRRLRSGADRGIEAATGPDGDPGRSEDGATGDESVPGGRAPGDRPGDETVRGDLPAEEEAGGDHPPEEDPGTGYTEPESGGDPAGDDLSGDDPGDDVPDSGDPGDDPGDDDPGDAAPGEDGSGEDASGEDDGRGDGSGGDDPAGD